MHTNSRVKNRTQVTRSSSEDRNESRPPAMLHRSVKECSTSALLQTEAEHKYKFASHSFIFMWLEKAHSVSRNNPKWENNLKDNRYVCMEGWITLLYT